MFLLVIPTQKKKKKRHFDSQYLVSAIFFIKETSDKLELVFDLKFSKFDFQILEINR